MAEVAASMVGPLGDALDDALRAAASQGMGPSGAAVAVVGAAPAMIVVSRGVTAAPPLSAEPVIASTRFDLASVTKLVTTLAVCRLVSDGVLELEAQVRTLVPALAGGLKDDVSLRQLLQHRAGLQEWWPLYANAGDGPAVQNDPVGALARVAALPLRYRPDDGRHYSDLGFMALGAVVEAAVGTDLRSAATQLVLEPLGMDGAGYGPIVAGGAGPRAVAATSHGDRWEMHMLATGQPHAVPAGPQDVPAPREHWLQGEVNDGNAHHSFAGVAGHAGLFASAPDAARLTAVLLEDHASFSTEVTAEFTAAGPDPEQALGWRRRSLVLADGRTVLALGHPGFTGTSVWAVPSLGVGWALLTNRLHRASSPWDLEPLNGAVERAVCELYA